MRPYRLLAASVAAFSTLPGLDWPALLEHRAWNPSPLAGGSLLVVAGLLWALDEVRVLRRHVVELELIRDGLPAGDAPYPAQGIREESRGR